MDNFGRVALWRLANHSTGPCVSLFLETHPAGRNGQQDAIRLKNLLREAERKLVGHWLSAAKASELLERAAKLVSQPSWQQRSKGLAIFIAAGFFEAFRISQPLAEQVSVANRFRVRPLLPLLEQQQRFYLLVLSENQTALYSVDEQSIEKIDVPGLPASLTDAVGELTADRGAQVHSAMRGPTGKQAAVFHGQGGQTDTRKEDLQTYCARIDGALIRWLGVSNRPLLLAAVDRLATVYRKANSYPYLLETTFAGNHDRDSEHELQAGARQIVQPWLKTAASEAATLFADRLGTPRTSDDPCEVVSAALQGRVDRLLYDPAAKLCGHFDVMGSAVEITGRDEDDDLVDVAAIETLRRKGSIHSMVDLELPTNSPLAAVLRY